ncbi:MAG: ABC transporter substrate-binding protein [Deltaproteobacteria bacterium]|nr:ABC transporter substrate-binding protein [Deltaproteobacteria bacterium]
MIKDTKVKKLLYVVLSLLLLNQIVMAEEKTAEEVVRSKIDAVIAVLQQKELDQQAKKDKITEIVSPMFDFQIMAKLSLGRKYWTGLSRENRKKFTDLFIKRLKESYLNKMILYTDEKLVYEPPIQEKRKVHIPTYLIAKDGKTLMLYKLYASKNGWRLYDIEIEGVSIIQTYRSQFSQILENGTIEDLLSKLEKQDEN